MQRAKLSWSFGGNKTPYCIRLEAELSGTCDTLPPGETQHWAPRQPIPSVKGLGGLRLWSHYITWYTLKKNAFPREICAAVQQCVRQHSQILLKFPLLSPSPQSLPPPHVHSPPPPDTHARITETSSRDLDYFTALPSSRLSLKRFPQSLPHFSHFSHFPKFAPRGSPRANTVCLLPSFPKCASSRLRGIVAFFLRLAPNRFLRLCLTLDALLSTASKSNSEASVRDAHWLVQT